MNLTEMVKTIRLKPDGSTFAVAAGAADINSDVVDMQNFENVRFMVGFGAITSGAATSIKVQQGTDATVTDAADLLGTSVTVADTDDNQVAIVEIYKPRERYLRVVTKRATQNSVVDFAIAELWGAKKLPITDDAATTIGNEIHISPAEGTA